MKNILLVFALLDGAKEEQMQEFLEEILVMKQIGYHLNILNLLACCTMTSPMFLVVEFAKNGDLLRYLRKRREQVKWDSWIYTSLAVISLQWPLSSSRWRCGEVWLYSLSWENSKTRCAIWMPWCRSTPYWSFPCLPSLRQHKQVELLPPPPNLRRIMLFSSSHNVFKWGEAFNYESKESH